MLSEKITIRLVAFIELLIGLSMSFGLLAYSLLSISKKPLNVFIFVLLSATISTIIGAGLLNYREWSRNLLVFFSGYVILTKILIIAGLLRFNGEIIAVIPAGFKNCISILYHGFVILFFNHKTVKGYFAKR